MKRCHALIAAAQTSKA